LSLLFCGAVVLAGCEASVKRVPVTGTVTLDGQPLSGGVLLFHPNEAKGNTSRVSCTGPVNNGKFNLVTSGVTKNETGSGAPLGWYKVTLLTDLPGTKPIAVHPKYLKAESTPLEVEITDNPPAGAYDFKMTK
jgi:hypothetical protein